MRMPDFSSSRERRLWVWALVVVVAMILVQGFLGGVGPRGGRALKDAWQAVE